MNLTSISSNLPEVATPTQKRLPFKEKLKWTLIILVLYYILGMIPLFGLGENSLQQFQFLSMILGAEFGSIISLGIGPIVTASIVLQLLNGSGIMKFDLTTHEGKMKFQGLQKVLSLFFIILESVIYVFMGGLAPANSLAGTPMYLTMQLLLVIQLFIGGVLILFMDEVVSKWGFGSGISLFIAAGVSKHIFVRAFSPFSSPMNPDIPVGAIPSFIVSISHGNPVNAAVEFGMVVATVVVFVMAVYFQAMKVEIPLSFGRVRGQGMRWPLSFIYTSNIPVILVAALFANIQLWARLLQNWNMPILGTFVGNQPVSGLVRWTRAPLLLQSFIKGSLQFSDILDGAGYVLLFLVGCVIFSWFWMQTSGMDPKSVAKQIMSSGLQIPGFRRDQRVLERLLERYINPLTILGGGAVGILAAVADLTGAFGTGTGILLAVMIVYNLYEEIARDHMMDMYPALRRFMGGS